MNPLAWPSERVFIIAEAGVNHNGDVGLAMKLIDAAAEAKADAVKFQTWKPGEITGQFAFKVNYLETSTAASESRYELSRRLALPFEDFRRLQVHANKRGILFLSTPDGFESLDFLADELRLPLIKVGSTEVTHPQFLEAVGRKGRPVILSTGLSDLEEVRQAVAAVRRGGDVALTVLQCTSEYPAPYSEINLRAMTSMREAFGLPTGLSDHSSGYEAPIAAVALGARVVEKHFTFDKTLPGPDHKASLSPQELRLLVISIRNTEELLGDGIKRPTASEMKNMAGIRRSVVAARKLAHGQIVSPDMLSCKRPGTGIAPGLLKSIIGKRLIKDLEEDEPIQWQHLE